MGACVCQHFPSQGKILYETLKSYYYFTIAGRNECRTIQKLAIYVSQLCTECSRILASNAVVQGGHAELVQLCEHFMQQLTCVDATNIRGKVHRLQQVYKWGLAVRVTNMPISTSAVQMVCYCERMSTPTLQSGGRDMLFVGWNSAVCGKFVGRHIIVVISGISGW